MSKSTVCQMATGKISKTANHSANHTGSQTATAGVDRAVAFVTKGASLTKVRSKFSKNERNFVVNQDLSVLSYSGSRKWSTRKRSNRFSLADIQEIRLGSGSDTFSIAYGSKEHCPPESRCFSLVLREEGEILDLVAQSDDERLLWVTGIEECRLRSQMKSTNAAEVFHLWVKHLFHEADKDSNGELSVRETTRILNHMNLDMNETETAQRMKPKKALKLDEFGEFIMTIINKEEIETEIFKKYGKGEKGQEYWTKNDLFQFLTREEGGNVTIEQCERIIRENETCPDFKRNNWFSLAGLTAFLDTDRMSIMDPRCHVVYQDMTKPLSHYFIDSSHNTYLESDQLQGYSKLECYIRALKSGCRCVEMDVWDGPDMTPVVTHGFTLTSKLLFAEVVRVVDKYAFVKSNYPLILSIENHCSVEQQKVMARTMKAAFGVKLFLDDLLQNSNYLPSPSDLMERIIVKCKKNSSKPTKPEDKRIRRCKTVDATVSGGARHGSDDEEDGVDGEEEEEEEETAPEFSECINICQSARFKSFQDSRVNQSFRMILSFSETKSLKLSKSNPADFIQHNKRQLSRIFPAGSRFGSTNYDPVPFWIVGCQVVALNYQTPDEPMQLNRGLFGDNGGCGYILKPDFMTSFTSRATFSPDELHPLNWNRTLRFRILSGFCLPKKEGDGSKSILDPYVEVSVTGIQKDRKTFKTEVVFNNGFHPTWKTCDFEFFVSCPELALLHIKVFDHETRKSDVVIAQFCLPFRCIQRGYRTVHLKTVGGELIPSAKLYVHISIS